MPLTRDAIWKDFNEVTKDGVARAECQLCEQDIVPLVPRMENDVEERCKRRITAEEEASPTKRMKQPTLGLVSTSAHKQHDINLQLTRYLVATNTPFMAAQNNQLKKLVTVLRPGTTIADRRTVACPLLEKISDEKKQEAITKVQ